MLLQCCAFIVKTSTLIAKNRNLKLGNRFIKSSRVELKNATKISRISCAVIPRDGLMHYHALSKVQCVTEKQRADADVEKRSTATD